MLRTERGRDPQVTASRERIERVREIFRDRSWMCEQCNAPTAERRAQRGVGEKSIDTKFHGASRWRKFMRKAIGMMEVGLAWWMGQSPVGFATARFFDDGRETEAPGTEKPLGITWETGHVIEFQRAGIRA